MSDTTHILDEDRPAAFAPPGNEEASKPSMKVIRRHHPVRAAATAALIACIALVIANVANSPALDYGAIGQYLFDPEIIRGLRTTVFLSVVSMAIAIALGVVLALMQRSDGHAFRGIANVYVWVFRGTPQIVQLVMWFNLGVIFKTMSLTIPGGPTLFSVPTNTVMSGFVAALLGFSLNEAAYMAEIIRGGLLAVDPGQTEAALSLGMRRLAVMRRVVLPQATRVILPAAGNEFITLLKATSLVSVIAGGDLLTNAQAIYAKNFLILELLTVVSIWYLILTTLATIGQRALERHFARGVQPSRGMGRLPRAFSPPWRRA